MKIETIRTVTVEVTKADIIAGLKLLHPDDVGVQAIPTTPNTIEMQLAVGAVTLKFSRPSSI